MAVAQEHPRSRIRSCAAVLARPRLNHLAARKKQSDATAEAVRRILDVPVEPFTYQQKITIIGVLVLMACVLVFRVDVGLTASFTIGAALTMLNAADEGNAIKAMPWPTILLICGVTVLIGLMQNVGDMARFAGLIATAGSSSRC